MFANHRDWYVLLKTRLYVICILVIASLLSCDRGGRENNAPRRVRERSNVHAPSTKDDKKTTDDRIRAGYGLHTCHVGMLSSELGTGWKSLKDPDLKDYLINESKNIQILQKSGRVASVFFYYFGPDHQPFLGVTDDGIDFKSSIDDVRKTRGDPSFILRRTQSEFGEFPGSQETLVAYMEDGILFQFIDDMLQLITVKPPQSDFDYDTAERSSKDVFVYIRPPEKRNTRRVQE